jgi:hypothetical protein
MNLPELCIRRPVMTTLVMAAIMVFGVVGYRQLPISALPKVDFPTIVEPQRRQRQDHGVLGGDADRKEAFGDRRYCLA